MDNIRSMNLTNPALPDAIVELQSNLIKAKKWENVLAVGYVFRHNFVMDASTFRVEPFLMEAYGLIQYCHYDDAKAVLDQGKYFAQKFNRKEDLQKLEKASELEKLSKLYKNLNPQKELETRFMSNQLEWPVKASNKELIQVLDQVVIKTGSLCQ